MKLDAHLVKKLKNSSRVPKSKIFGIDLDGVCFDFLGGFGKFLESNHGIKIKLENLSSYHWTGFDPVLKEKIWKVYFHDFCHAHGLLTLDVIPGARNGLKLLLDMGNTIHFITSREPYCLDDTLQVIEDKLNISNPSVFIAEHHGKAPFVNSLNVDVCIDDSPSTLAELAANTRAQVYCMDQPYNQEVDCTFIKRVKTWEEFLIAEGWLKNVN